MSDARQSALEAIARVTGLAIVELTPDKDLVADLGIDSPRALHLLIELEDRIGIEISDEAAEQLATVGDVLNLVDEATAE